MYLRVWTEVSVSGSSYYGIYVDTVVKFEVSSWSDDDIYWLFWSRTLILEHKHLDSDENRLEN